MPIRLSRSRGWWVAAGLLGLAGLTAGGFVLFSGDRGSPTDPDVSEAPVRAALSGTLDVRLWENGNPLRQELRLHQPRALPVKVGDLLQIEVKMNQPAYLYLVWLESSGKAVPVWPWDDGDWTQRPADEQPRERLLLPENIAEGAPVGGGPSGVESILLLCRTTPLPAGADAELAAVCQLPPQPAGPLAPRAVWLRNGEEITDEDNRGAIGKAVGIRDPVLQTRGLLRERLSKWFAFSRAVCFSFQGN